MIRYIIKRVLLIVPLLLGVSIVCFILVNLNPSSPAEVTLRINNITVTPQAIEETKKELGLNKPLVQQYIQWIKNLLNADLGTSYETKQPVFDELIQALPVTIYLSFSAILLIAIFGFTIGVLCAVYENSYFDKLARVFIFTSAAMPSFWLALLLIWLFSLKFNIFPSSGLDGIKSIVLPAITLAVAYISTFIRIIRNSLIQIKSSLFITYAKARGLNKFEILKHKIKNIINPFIVALAMSIPKLFAGTVIIENIFGLPGLGRLCVHAIFARDYPIIQSYILFIAILFIIFNLIADIWLQVRDPRLRV
ncbi:nickel ABC transporter permease subunit NikB [Malaciobacter halophilus]|uniref:Nickel ABC transporter permease subunit NikB n=1 Tax=Malaciobacter halophilus TaxID=197482 RepID=A0A2N1J3H4_9BACT|nr:nickel/cobalt ABC transporter permease [Malaciobacter halophilus]AXH09093.1 nickel ABC transporter, permease protein [Malaciobacter halophilus]PKI81110.1 nickel ABC transporter permease subunit NikB [Malaciobacter halophilus]